MVQFVGYLSAKGLSYATVRSYLAGLSYLTKLQDFQDPTDQFLVSKLLQGLKRIKHTQDSRLPITKHLLQRIITILPSVCKDNYESLLFSSAFSIAFYGLLRVSEVIVTPKQNHRVLLREHLHIDHINKQLHLLVKFSKTDQTGKGTTLHIQSTGDLTCPYALVTKYLSVHSNPKGPLFCHLGGFPVTRYQFSAVLTKAISALNIDATPYKSHSFRIGASTELALKGYPSDIIQTSGRWRSNCYKSYIRMPKF